MVYIILALGVLATVAFLYLRVKKGGIPALLAKTIASIFFILTAVVACIGGDDPLLKQGLVLRSYGIYIIVGLVFGMLGDIWLDLKWIYPEDNDIYTYAGMVSFGIGHFFFLHAIYSGSKMFDISAWYLVVPLLVAIVFGVGAVLLEKLMKLVYGKFKIISGAYGVILSFMTFSSIAAMIATNFEDLTFIIMSVGGVFFLVSDLVLSGMYFDKDKSKNTPANIIVNHATYYIAQYLIALSALLIF